MNCVARREVELLRHVRAELATLRCDGQSAIARIMEPVHELLGGERLWTYRPVRTLRAWDVTDVHDTCVGGALLDRFAACLRGITDEFAWFRPSEPEPAQRNRVVEALSAVRSARPGFFEQTPLYREFFEPNGLHEHHQLRVLVCDGAELLAWFGAYYTEAPTARQRQLLASMVPALRKRLRLDRALSRTRVASVALAAAIDNLEQPAFVVDRRNMVEHANASGRALLASHASEPADVETFDLGHGAKLKLVRRHAQLDRQARIAAARWALTRRQTDVLVGIAAGHANATIAEQLGVTLRAVEHHVTTILIRAGAANRVELVARIASEEP